MRPLAPCSWRFIRGPLLSLLPILIAAAPSAAQRLLTESELAEQETYQSLDDALKHVDEAYKLVITSGIDELPASVGRLTRLQELTVKTTRITTLPPEIGRLTNLQTLNLCCMVSLPPEIGDLRNLRVLNATLGQLHTLPSSIGSLAELRVLDLSNNGLTELPPGLGALHNLEELNLSGNPLGTLPPAIGGLSNLRRLNILSTRLTALPPEIGMLGRLEYLTALRNELTALPPQFGNLTLLEDLWLSDNAITDLPDAMRHLENLTLLSMSNNRLTRLPSWIGELKNLESLLLNANAIEALPPEIGDLARLKGLYLGGNALTEVPHQIGNLSQLRTLRLGDNELQAIPATIARLARLEVLDLRGNRIASLPEEVAQIREIPDYRGQRDPEINRLYGLPDGPAIFERAAELAMADTLPAVDRARSIVAAVDSVQAGLDAGVDLQPGDVERAGAALGAYLETNTEDVEALILFARLGMISNLETPTVFTRGDDVPDAEAPYAPLHAALDRALEIEPDNPEAMYWKARLFGVRVPDLSSGRMAYRFLSLPGAIELAERALALAPHNVLYREALATFLVSDGREADAREVLHNVMGGQHPMYLLLTDLQRIPVPANAIFSPEDSESFAQMQGIVDNASLRLRMYVVPGSADDLERFFAQHWEGFQFVVQSVDGGEGYAQHLIEQNGALVPARPGSEIDEAPAEGILMFVMELDDVPTETPAGHALPSDLGAPYCFLIIVNLR